MGRVINYVCDAPSCNSIRGNTNHWFIYEIKMDDWISFALLEDHEDLLTEESQAETQAERGCVCSRGCAQKVFEAFLTDQLNLLTTTKKED